MKTGFLSFSSKASIRPARWALLVACGLCMVLPRYVQAQQNKVACEIFGAVFVEANATQANYRVYIEKSEAFADLPVYQVQNSLFADRSGLWFLTPTRAQAKYTIAYVADRAMADFSIFFIANESFAGCR